MNRVIISLKELMLLILVVSRHREVVDLTGLGALKLEQRKLDLGSVGNARYIIGYISDCAVESFEYLGNLTALLDENIGHANENPKRGQQIIQKERREHSFNKERLEAKCLHLSTCKSPSRAGGKSMYIFSCPDPAGTLE